MPIYNYECPNCGRQKEMLRPMSKYDDCPPCPACIEFGGIPSVHMKRIFVAGRKRDKNFRKPIEMFSVAPDSPAELADLRQKCPDVQFTPELVPLAHNRREKKRILRAVGFEERS